LDKAWDWTWDVGSDIVSGAGDVLSDVGEWVSHNADALGDIALDALQIIGGAGLFLWGGGMFLGGAAACAASVPAMATGVGAALTAGVCTAGWAPWPAGWPSWAAVSP
jgi:hypothetical protein